MMESPLDLLPVPPPPDRPPGLLKRLREPRTLLSIAVAVGLLSYSLRRLEPHVMADLWSQIRSADVRFYAVALGVYYLAFPIRAARWRILLTNAGAPRDLIPARRYLAENIYLSWFVNSLTPAKLGDVFRGWLLRRTTGITWSLGMGTIVAERLLDVIVLVALMIGSGILTYRAVLSGGDAEPITCVLPGNLPVARLGPVLLEIFTIAGVALVVLVVGLVGFARYGAHLERVLPKRMGDIYVRFSGGLVYSFGRFGPLIAFSLLAWLAEAARFYFVGQALGHALPFALVFFFSLVSAFLTTIPITPGGVGFEGILAAALCMHGFGPADAWSLALMDRSLSYLSLVVGGALVYAWSPRTK
jgi:uncharacterized membrane protein YbhN (UPF0104 family)